MTTAELDAEKFGGEIRRFLKKVGITSQAEIEKAVQAALAAGRLDASKPLHARMVLEVGALDVRHVIEQDLELS